MITKRFIAFIALMMVLFMPSKGQMVFWEESFDATPPGWEIEGNWTFVPGALYMYYYPVVMNYDFSVTSPEITLPENTGELIVTQFLSFFEPSVTIEQSSISVLHEGDETVLWLYQNSTGNWGAAGGSDLNLPLSEFSGQTIQIKFRTWGPTTDSWWDWSVYNVRITALFENDLMAAEVYGPTKVKVNEQATWEIKIVNSGMNQQNGFTVRLFSYKSTEELASMVITNPLNPGQTGLYEITWTPEEIQNTCLYGVVETPVDDFLSNNSGPPHFLRVEPLMNYNVLVWDNDNGIETIINPESGISEEGHTGLVKALNHAGIMYEYSHTLPEDLSPYDLVISTMGCYCLG